MAISNFVSRYMRSEPPEIYGDGKQTRDFTYITDVVDANCRLLTDDSADGAGCTEIWEHLSDEREETQN